MPNRRRFFDGLKTKLAAMLFLALLPSALFAETPAELQAKLDAATTLAEQKAIIDKVVHWESTVILGARAYPKPELRFDYLAILFSDKILTTPALTSLVHEKLVDLIRGGSWLGEIRESYQQALTTKNPLRLRTLVSLRAFGEGSTNSSATGPSQYRTLPDRLNHLMGELRTAGVTEQAASFVFRGLLLRVHHNGYSRYEEFLNRREFNSVSDVETEALLRMMPKPAPPPPAFAAPASAATRDVAPAAPAAPVVVARPAVPATAPPAPAAAVPVVPPGPPAPGAVAPVPGPRQQSVQEWRELLHELQDVERRLNGETVAARRVALTAEADQLFERGRRLSNAIFGSLDVGQPPPVDLAASRRQANQFADEHLESLRLEVFLPYLNGMTPGQIRGNPEEWVTPRTSALAAVALSFSVFRVKASEGATEIANSISVANGHYGADVLAPLAPRVSGYIPTAFQRAEALYRRAVTESVIGQTRNASTFVPSAADQAGLATLAGPASAIDPAQYQPILRSFGRSHSMEVFNGLMARLGDLEGLLAGSTLSAPDRAKMTALADQILETLKVMGSGAPLTVTGERFHFSSGGTARRLFRGHEMLPYLRAPASPRMVAGALYGLAGAALHHRSSTSETRRNAELLEGNTCAAALPLPMQIDPRVVAATTQFREAHSWAIPPRQLPMGPYQPVDPLVTATPVQPVGTSGQDGTNARRVRFLPIEWATNAFIDGTPLQADRDLLRAIEVFLPGANPTSTERREALATLRAAQPTDLGLILALADALRENRLVSYQGHTGATPPVRSTREAHLLAALNRWTSNYRRIRVSTEYRDATDERKAEILPTSVASRILSLPDLESSDALLRCEREAAPRLNRLFTASGDPALMEAGSRTIASLSLNALARRERADAGSRLRAILADASADEYFSERTRIMFRRLLRRLGEPLVEPVPVAPPAVVVPPPPPPVPAASLAANARPAMTADELRDSLNVLSGKSGLRLPAAAVTELWNALLIESLERGISDVKALEVLLNWVQDTSNPVADRGRALRLLLHSYDHLTTVFQTNRALAEQMDEAVVGLRRELRQLQTTGAVDPVFAAVIEGFNRLRFGQEPIALVVSDVATTINCRVFLGAVGAGRFAPAAP